MQGKKLAEEIFSDALEASLPKNFISKYCTFLEDRLSIGGDVYNLNDYKKVYLFASGKAASTMAKEIEVLLGRG